MQGLEILLHKGPTLRLKGAAGCSIEVTEGCVWVTQDKDGADHIVETGGIFRLDRAGTAFISALRPGRMRLAGGITALLQ